MQIAQCLYSRIGMTQYTIQCYQTLVLEGGGYNVQIKIMQVLYNIIMIYFID